MFDFANASSISASSKVTKVKYFPFQSEAKLLPHDGSYIRGGNIVVNIFKAICNNITGNKAITKRN